MKEKTLGEVYLVTCTITGKQYVGITIQGYQHRWKKHVSCALREKDDFKFHAAIRKYGADNFKIEVIESKSYSNPKRLINWLFRREKFWITKLKTKRYGYNSTEGGDGVPGLNLSKEARNAISERMKQFYVENPEMKKLIVQNAHAKMRDPEYRKINSQRMKQLMSDEKKRQQISEKVKEKMAQLPTDVKEKIRQHQFKEGHETWNKGIETPEEVRKKISESEKGRIAWNRGIPMSEEQKRKLSESKKGVWAWNKGKTVETLVCPVCGKEIAWSSMSKHMRARHKSSEEDIKEFLNFARKSKV